MSITGKEYKLAIRIAGIIDKSFNVSLGSASKSLKGFVRSVDNTFTQMDKYGNAAFRALTTAATVAATAVGAVEVAAIKAGSEFEAQMSAVQAIAQASNFELDQLSDKARELGESSVFSATEVGKAMEYMGLAGWKTEQMLDGIEGVLNLAAASGEDLATVSDIVTDQLTAFNMTAEETERMVDVMAATAMNSNTTVAMMGDALKYVGSVAGMEKYQIEDIAIATGAIASSSIKASMAGTALRAMISRMASENKNAVPAMEALGISLTKDTGEMYSFLEVVQQLREGMKNFDPIERAKLAKGLGGERGMAAVSALANMSEKEFTNLTLAIQNSKGAAEEMAKIRLDNLKGDVQILTDTVKDLGIELYMNQNGALRSIVQTTTKFFASLKENLPDIGRKIGKTIVPIFDKVLDFGKWIMGNGDDVVSILGGIATAILTFKTLSTASHAVNAIIEIVKLPYGPAILGITALVGAISALIIKKKQLDRELTNASLERHFGNFSLSLKELQEVARGLIEDESLIKIEYALRAYEQLDGIADNIEDTAAAIKKLNWKTQFGIELSSKENESYKEYIESYINDAQEYITQAQYAANLNLSEYFGEDSETLTKVNAFFDRSRDELTEEAKKLSDAVNEAFNNDGLLKVDEVTAISSYQESMKNIMDKLATSELNASTTLIRAKYGSMADLDADSFMALQDEVNEQLDKFAETQEESYKAAYAVAEAAGSSQEELDTIAMGYLNRISEKQAELTKLMEDTIADAYDIDYESMTDIISKKLSDREFDFTINDAALIEEAARSAYDNLSEDNVLAIKELLKQLEPQEEQLEALAEKYREAGEGIPANILEGIKRYQELQLMTGDTENLWEYFGTVLAESPEREELLKELENAGKEVPEEIQRAIEDNLSKIDPAVEKMYNETQSAIDSDFGQGFDVDTTIRVNADVVIQGGLKQIPNAEDFFDHNANGGIITSPELSWLAERGPEAVVPLDGSRNALSLWEKAGRLLGMGNLLDKYDLSGGTQTANIEYRPTLHFHGQAPSKDDLDEALSLSQDRFDAMMEHYLKTNGRVSLA